MQLRSHTQASANLGTRTRTHGSSQPLSASATQRLAPRTAFLVGRGPLPPISRAEKAAATLRNALDGRGGPGSQALLAQRDNILVRVPTSGAITSDILVPSNASYRAFLNQVCCAMGIDANVAKLGWKTTRDRKNATPRELQTPVQLQTAIQTFLRMSTNPRVYTELAIVIVHLNPHAPAYEMELLSLQGKLRCAQHVGGDRWCYVKPSSHNADDHIPLCIEELNLWARNIHEGHADKTCIVPPECFSWSPKPEIRSEPLNILLKRKYREMEDDGNDSSCFTDDGRRENLLMSSHIWSLHAKFPELNFPQYLVQFQARGLFYARSALHFEPSYYLGLGMMEGAVGTFLEETGKALRNRRSRDKGAGSAGKRYKPAHTPSSANMPESDSDSNAADLGLLGDNDSESDLEAHPGHIDSDMISMEI